MPQHQPLRALLPEVFRHLLVPVKYHAPPIRLRRLVTVKRAVSQGLADPISHRGVHRLKPSPAMAFNRALQMIVAVV